jgi:predicted acetyltransferase
MPYPLRRFDESDLDAVIAVLAEGFGFDPKEEDTALDRAVLEWDRTTAAVDGDTIVGSAGSFTFQLTVPGEVTIPAGGLTIVSVLPTHRRRGVLNAMMEHQLDDTVERGEPVSILWASESVIYQRYGYGQATYSAKVTVDSSAVSLRYGAEPDDQLRLVSAEEARKVVPEVYDRHRLGIPGQVDRPSDAWWDVWQADLEHWRDGATKYRYVLHDGPHGVDGYARYRIKSKWDDGLPNGEVMSNNLVAETPVAYASLWNHLLSVDLTRVVNVYGRPREEPLWAMIDDPRRINVRANDGIWLRVLDVAGALAGRRYAVEDRVVIGVHDDSRPATSGTYELVGGPDGAESRRVDAEPDLEMDVAALGARYLGDHSFVNLAAAGRVTGAPEAIRRADAMFTSAVVPHCSTGF